MSARVRNVVVVLADELREDVATHRRYGFVRTPALDQLRSEGVTVDNTFVPYPICGPSRASLFTGRYPLQTGVTTNASLLPPDERTLGHHLRDHGFDTVAFGKTHGQNPGFRLHPEPDALTSLGTTNMGYEAESERIVGCFEAPVERHYDAIVVQQACAYLRDRAANAPPFAMFVGLHAPHPPLYPPRPFFGMYDHLIETLPEPSEAIPDTKPTMQHELARRRWLCHPPEVRRRMIGAYLALVSLVDARLAEVLACLRETQREEDTLVVFMSDHGDQLGDHNLIGKFSSFFEPTIRVPLVMRLPGVLAPGGKLPGLVETIDLYPTICELIGVAIPAGVAGHTLVPALRDGEPVERNHVFCMNNRGFMVRTERHKLAFYPDDLLELYDLANDPGERVNLGSDPSTLALRAHLMTLLLGDVYRWRREPPLEGLNRSLP